jgi:hypothetical protein
MEDKLTWKNTELTADDYKETSSIERKAVEIETVFNLQSDGGEVGKASLIIPNLLLKKHLEASCKNESAGSNILRL